MYSLPLGACSAACSTADIWSFFLTLCSRGACQRWQRIRECNPVHEQRGDVGAEQRGERNLHRHENQYEQRDRHGELGGFTHVKRPRHPLRRRARGRRETDERKCRAGDGRDATTRERAQTGSTAPHRETNCRGHNGNDDLTEHYARCQPPRLGQLKGDHDTPTASRQSLNTTTGPRRTQADRSNVRKLFGLATTYVCLGQGRALYTPTPCPSTQKAIERSVFSRLLFTYSIAVT